MAANKYQNYGVTASSKDFDRDITLKVTPHVTVRGVLDSLLFSDSRWGQSIGVKMTDVRLVDGLAYARVDADGERDGTVKLFAWENMPVDLSSYTSEDAPKIHTEKITNNTYRYELLGARIEETEPDSELTDIGDCVVWESGQNKPSASSKIIAQTLSASGKGVIADRDDVFNWLNPHAVELREDLIGREVDFFKVVRQGDEHNFHSPILLDVKTGQQVKIDNSASEPVGSTESSATMSVTEAAASMTSATPDSAGTMIPPHVSDFISFCRDTQISNESDIVSIMNELVENPDNGLTQSMVDQVGQSAIVSAIVQ